MRVTTKYQYDTYIANMREAQANYFAAQERVTTGKRFNRVSDDPVSAMTALNARSLKARLEQLNKNLQTAKEYTGTTESVLDEVNSALKQAYTLAIQGASDATTQESRDAMADQVASIQKRIVDLANTQGLNGKYIFAGQQSATRPFSDTSGTLTFSGDDLPIQVEVRPAETMRVNLDAPDTVFGDVYSALQNLQNDLRSNDVGKLSNQDVAAVRGQIDQVGVVRGLNATKVQEIDRLDQEGQRRMDDLTKTISDNEDIDMAEAITQMQAAETAYTASLQVTSKGFQLSLMDFLQ